MIINSCPAQSFLGAEIFALTTAGADPQDADELYRRLGRAAADGADTATGREIFADFRQRPWHRTVLGEFELTQDLWTQFTTWADFDPHDDLSRLATPCLATFGELDAVVPVKDSVAVFRRTARQPGRDQEVRIFPDADHRVRSPDGEFASGYLETLCRRCSPAAR